MAFYMDEEANLTLVQGDSGHIIVSGIPTDKDYKVCLAFSNSKRQILSEIYMQSASNGVNRDTLDFFVSGAVTDNFTVPLSKETETYYYSVKICQTTDQTEDTVALGSNDITTFNTVTVYPKRVEGLSA